MTKPLYEVGDVVYRGPAGKVPHRVLAVIDTGRVTTYDLIEVKTSHRDRYTDPKRYQAVPEHKLVTRRRDVRGRL